MRIFKDIISVFSCIGFIFIFGCAENPVKKEPDPIKQVSTAGHAYCIQCGGLSLIKCTFCDGYGVSGDCFFCKGTGKTQGNFRCYTCKGTGNKKCPFCGGLGIKKCPNEVSESGVTKGLSDSLRTSFFKTGKFIILDRSKMEDIFKEQKLQLSGCTSNECAVEIGKILNVRYIVSGSVVKIGSEFVLNLRFTDVESSEVVVSEIVKCPFEADLVASIENLASDTAIKMEKLQQNPKARSIAILDLEVK